MQARVQTSAWSRRSPTRVPSADRTRHPVTHLARRLKSTRDSTVTRAAVRCRDVALPQSLELLSGTPVNCLLVKSVDAAFADKAKERGIVVLAVVNSDTDPVPTTLRAIRSQYQGVVLEGDFPKGTLGRVKDKNVRRDRRVAISIQDPDKPYRYLEVRGRVVEITQDGAEEHVNKLSQKYLGKPVYPYRQPGEVRVTYKIEPQKISSMG